MNFNQLTNSPLFKMLSTSRGNPGAAIQNIMNQNPQMKNNPMFQNALKMMQSGDNGGLETMARNLVSQQGGDPDQVYNMVKSMLGRR